MKRFSLFLLLCFPGLAWSQSNPGVVQVTPNPHTVGVQPWEEIIVEFDTVLSVITVNNQNIRIIGDLSGPIAGSLSTSNGNKTIRFSPTENFIAGEYVTVNLSTGIKSYPQFGNDPMLQGYSWSFWIKAGTGSLDFYPVDTISTRTPQETWVQSSSAYAGDLNNDGFSDISVVNTQTNDLRVFINDGLGFFAPFYSLGVKGGNLPMPICPGDFNDDDAIDLAIGSTGSTAITAMLMDGTGQITADSVFFPGQNIRAIGALDLNGDAYEDIVVSNVDDNNLGILLNDGTGSYSTTTFEGGMDGEHGLCIVDMNNDGLQDIVVGGTANGELQVMLNQGNGAVNALAPTAAQGEPVFLIGGDLNNDGQADVVSANANANTISVAFGDGTGQFSNIQTYSSGQSPENIALGDLDGDGDLGVVVSNAVSADFHLFVNDGFGGLTLYAVHQAPQMASYTLIHDRNNDGDLDMTFVDELSDVILPFDDDSTIAYWSVPDISKPIGTILVYPNPSKGSFSFQINGDKNASAELVIFSLDGKVIHLKTHMLFNGSNTIAVDLSLAAGAYYYQWSNSSGTQAGKLLITEE